MAARSFTDKLFWPVTALAVLALGAVGYTFYLMFAPHHSRPSAPAVAVVAAPPSHSENVTAAPPKPVVAAPEVDSTPAPVKADAAMAPVDAAEVAPAAEEAPKAQADVAKVEMPKPDINPYAVPENKPFISHEMFQKQPVAAAKPAAKPGEKPKTPVAAPKAVAVVKPPPPPAVPLTPLTTAPLTNSPDRLASALPGIRGKVYVLKDGRRIPAVSTVDLGESYGVKDLNSSFITIPKSDVTDIIAR